MSEFITHIAVFEDCSRLALISPDICDPFKSVLKKYWDIASVGTLTRSGDRYTIPVLQYCRDHWSTRREGDLIEEKLAYVLGWRCHNAADRQFKPIYREVEPEHYKNEVQQSDPDERDVSDVRIYHDIIVFREVYDFGHRKGIFMSPYLLEDNLSGHPAARSVAVAPVETAIGEVIQRTLLELQTFATKERNGDAWLKRFHSQLQDYYVDIHRYARAAESPEPDYLRRFILDNNFYDRRDPLIQIARALQLNEARPTTPLATAVQQAENQSKYAQAVRKAYLYFIACSEFFNRKIDEPELRHRLDIGTAHYKALGGGQ